MDIEPITVQVAPKNQTAQNTLESSTEESEGSSTN